MQISINSLKELSTNTQLDSLTREQVTDLQRALAIFAYPVGNVDGLIGSRTKNAWAEFKEDEYQGSPDLIGEGSVNLLRNKLTNIQRRYAKYNFSTQRSTKSAICNEAAAQGIGSASQMAYILATVEHETASTFKPVREAYWKSEAWRRAKFRYFPYYGRGYVQLTWKRNYYKYATLLGVDLVRSPDKAMQPDIALFVLIHGFKTGLFTGRKITDYINSYKQDLVNCRRCINGMDKADHIANLAQKYTVAPLNS